MRKWFENTTHRKWVYDGASLVGAVLVAYGVVSEEEVTTLLGVVSIVTNQLARNNVNE